MLEHKVKKPGLIFWVTALLSCGALVAGLTMIASPASIAQGSTEPLVTVTGGRVQGRSLSAPGGAVFKGIPYAAPPVGDLRWRETQPVKPWTGMLQAGAYGAACPQLPGASAESKALAATSKEDCLFLNVWAPEWPPRAKKPVMMWIHGGDLSNASGQGGLGIEPPYDGTNLARHGVVVVTINYRMGLLGMIGHPELTAESPHHSSGNYALFDQIAALKWIHENIARFGGDPNNVTLFGQSGGARFTGMLLTSPLTKGLIHRAILESAQNTARRPYLTKAQLEQSGLALAAALRAPSTGAIKYLRGLPASQIAAATQEVSKRLKEMNYLALDQGVDSYLIPQNPPEVYRSHGEAPVPMIIGTTALDNPGIMDRASPRLSPNASPEEKRARLKNILEIYYGKYPDLLERALKIYGISSAQNEVSTYSVYGTAETQLAVDLNHRCGSVVTASWHNGLAPTWQYEFTYASPGHPPVHEGELRFVWGYLGDEKSDEKARKLSDLMEQYWTNFAKTGDPNGPGLPMWPKYDTATKRYVDFTNGGPVRKGAIQAQACGVYLEKFNRDPKPLFGGENARLAAGG